MIKPLTKARLQKEYETNPQLFWEIMTYDMIGNIPKSIQAPAEEFLKTAGPKWEAYLLHQSWKIQRRAATEPKHHDSFLGMIAFIGWLLHMATRSPVRMQKESSKPAKKEEKVDIESNIKDFLSGMKQKQS